MSTHVLTHQIKLAAGKHRLVISLGGGTELKSPWTKLNRITRVYRYAAKASLDSTGEVANSLVWELTLRHDYALDVQK